MLANTDRAIRRKIKMEISPSQHWRAHEDAIRRNRQICLINFDEA